MKNSINYCFSIRRIEKSTDPDYLGALKIYNETTPYEIKTNSNEITYWLNYKDETIPFEAMYFALYYQENMAGFAMMSYIKSQRIVILEYIALKPEYRVNTLFFSYINLLENYLNINQYDVAFIINEISNRRNGNDIDKESQLFSKALCIEGYGKINAPYITPPLGNNNYESSFDAYLFAKSAGNIYKLEKQTYIDIIKSIYYDYFLVWYSKLLPTNEVQQYNEVINKTYSTIVKRLSDSIDISVTYTECPILKNNTNTLNTAGLPPTPKKKSKVIIYTLLALFILLFPIAITWVYQFVLTKMSIPINSVSSIIGSCIGGLLTACTTLIISKKKL